MLRAFVFAVVTLTGASAVAQETQTTADQPTVIETTVVKNRLYSMAGKFEVSPQVGFTIVNRLTDHYNFSVGAAYNISDTLAFELRGGYAYSRHTGLATQVGEHLLGRDPAPAGRTGEVKITSDMSGLWQMEGNGLAGVRWAPLYGKISLMAELPVHFQAYLWGGAGGGNFFRESIVYCQGNVQDRGGDHPVCGDGFRQDRKVTWIASAAVGMRFFTHQKGGIRLEVRDYTFPDSFRVDIDRSVAEKGGETGVDSTSPGLTHLVLFDVGYSFIF